ncbi:MAG TPA: hypothetical protein VI215_02760 [Bacteroidota bacterium]|jgi:hypothetical protein
MRTNYLIIAALAAAFLVSSAGQAQVGISLNFNVDRQPVWGPTGYDHVEYYYLPDIEAYYNVPQHMFYTNERGRWVGRSRLPSRFHNFDFYHSYKVVVNEREPYRQHDKYRDQYSSYRGRHDQEDIRDSRDSKYFVNKNHPQHNNWMKQQKHDNGNGKGRGRGNKHDDNNGQDNRGNQGHGDDKQK